MAHAYGSGVQHGGLPIVCSICMLYQTLRQRIDPFTDFHVVDTNRD